MIANRIQPEFFRLSWHILTLWIAITSACSYTKLSSQESLLLLEELKIEAEIPSRSSNWNMPVNSSLNSAHINFRKIGNETYYVFINSTLDSVIISNLTKENVTRIKLPLYHGSVVNLLYFHNPDSIFLFLDRKFVFQMRNEGVNLSDFILCNEAGQIENEYSLDEVPHIYNGQTNPMVYLRQGQIANCLIQKQSLFLPFDIYLPELADTLHKSNKIRMLCKFDLSQKRLKMLNISLPDDLIGKQFKSEYANGKMLDFLLLNDSILIYHFYNFGSVYSYNLNTNTSVEVFSAKDFPFKNNEFDDPDPPQLLFFRGFEFSERENAFIRDVAVESYKDYKPFVVVQILDNHFNNIGYQIYDGRRGYLLNDTNISSMFFDNTSHFSISHRFNKGSYYHVRPGNPTERTIAFIEENYLNQNEQPDVIATSFSSQYEERLLEYFGALEIPEGDKVIMIGFDKVCVHCLEFLFSAYQKNPKAFISERIYYLLVGAEPSLINQVIEGYKIPGELVLVDEQQIYLRYFAHEERSLNPLVHYKNSKEADLFIYDFKTLIKDFERFLKD